MQPYAEHNSQYALNNVGRPIPEQEKQKLKPARWPSPIKRPTRRVVRRVLVRVAPQNNTSDRVVQLGGVASSMGASYAFPAFPLASQGGCAAWVSGVRGYYRLQAGSFPNPFQVVDDIVNSAGDCLFRLSDIREHPDMALEIFLVGGVVANGSTIASVVFPPAALPAMLVGVVANKKLDERIKLHSRTHVQAVHRVTRAH